MPTRIAVLSLLCAVINGCSSLPTVPSITNSPRSAAFNASQNTTAPTAKSRRLTAGETPALRGYKDGSGDASVGDPRNPDRWLPQLGFILADQQIYRQEYYRGYDSVPPVSPTPTQSPTPAPSGAVTPERRAQLEQYGYQDGNNDIQTNQASNPSRGVFVWGLTKPEEIQIYTAAYNTGFNQRPSPTSSPGRLTELRQQGDTDGYNDARLSLSQDVSRGISRLGLVNAAEQRAYINGYSNGYQRYSASGSVGGQLW